MRAALLGLGIVVIAACGGGNNDNDNNHQGSGGKSTGGASSGGASSGGTSSGGTGGATGGTGGATGGTGGATGGSSGMDAGTDASAGSGGMAGSGGVAGADAGCLPWTGLPTHVPTWNKSFGTPLSDRAYAVVTDSSGNAFVAGVTDGTLGATSYGGSDAYVRKVSPSANELWTHQFGSTSGGNEDAYGIAMDWSGNVLVGGITAKGLTGASQGKFDGYVRKLTDGATAPTVAWTHQFGTSEDDYVLSVAADKYDNVYATGRTLGWLGDDDAGANAGSSDAYVRKLDGIGGVQWTHQFGTSAADQGYSVATDLIGSAYVTGYTEGDLAAPNAGGWDGFVSKVSPAGNELWTRQFGTAGADAGFGIVADVLGNVYVGGYVSGQVGCSSGGGADGFVRKYDSDGNELWTYQFGGPDFEQVLAITIGKGKVYAAGVRYDATTNLDSFVLALTTDGAPLWMQVLQNTAGKEYAQGVFPDLSGNVFVVGYEGTLNANQALIAKLAP